MIVIGEKLNSGFKSVKNAIEKKDTAFIQEIAKKQYDVGATYIDLNVGIFTKNEPQKLEWLVRTVQDAIDAPFSIDSTNPAAIEAALKTNINGKAIINSITDETDRFNSILPLAINYKTAVIALCMDDSGMPESVDERVKIAERLIVKLTREGIPEGDIYIDTMVRPVGTGSQYGVVVLETIRKMKVEFPGVHIACGISNISFGIPARQLMNQVFLVAAMAAGLDTAIMDPLDKRLMASIFAAEALLGKDEFCMDYQMRFREGLLDM